MDSQNIDVLIVGAGISGIGTAYWLSKKCPEKSFVILESRDKIGGTWSLFKYPGIRSDSDMFTFGYRFKPWTEAQSLSSGGKILSYIKSVVEENELDDQILFNHKMVSANWVSEKKRWEVQVETSSGKKIILCQFLSICTGYYDYKEAYRPSFAGEERFAGKIIQPQFWPEDLDYKGKDIAVIGSGATAVTLVPSLAENGAGHVTMIQRSPTYVMNLPNRNKLFFWLRKVLPLAWAYRLTRWQNISLQMISFGLSKWFPAFMKSFIMKQAAKELPEGFPVKKHFNPSYNPWDQRLCVVPDGDLFRSIREGNASIQTDEIENFDEHGVQLKSGDHSRADIIVLATGLKMQLLGGANIYIDNEKIETSSSLIYKGMMISNVPNLVYAFGYTNASWTLKVDLTANYLCKLINYMDKYDYEVVLAQKQALESEEDFLNLSSGYIKRAKNILPKQGKKRPWRVYQNYLVDMIATRFGKLSDKVLRFL